MLPCVVKPMSRFDELMRLAPSPQAHLECYRAWKAREINSDQFCTAYDRLTGDYRQQDRVLSDGRTKTATGDVKQ